ncbi:MAG TPA: hypothetical protein P5137_01055 [Candidatus Brocadiia bacterium]|nr:hypothetical protein [Candidatus Brocadiia bacterium]
MSNTTEGSCATRARSTCAVTTPDGAALAAVTAPAAPKPHSPAAHPFPSPKPDSPKAQVTRVCVLAAFGPGRPWLGSLFYNSFYNLLSVGERIELDVVVMDNSGPEEGGLWESLTALASSESRLLRRRSFLRDTTHVDRQRDGAVAVSGHVARLKNAMLDAVPADTDWVLSVEPDVEVPARGEGRRAGTCCGSPPPAGSQRVPGTAPHGKGQPVGSTDEGEPTILRQLLDAAQAVPEIGVLGCPIRSRQSRHVMVYLCASLDPWRLDRGAQLRRAGVEAVDSVSLGLTLIRASILRGFRFSATPNSDGSGGAGHEWSLMKHARLLGWQVCCHWDIQPRHFDTPERWV